jgi:hypothetical protein
VVERVERVVLLKELDGHEWICSLARVNRRTECTEVNTHSQFFEALVDIQIVDVRRAVFEPALKVL